MIKNIVIMMAALVFSACKKEKSCDGCINGNNPPVSVTNHPPIVNAGNDTSITLPANTINLDGSRSTDPDNNIASYQWTKISGPASFNIANADAVQTQVTNLMEGSYQFELKVTDAGGLTGKDTVLVFVQVFIDESGIYAAGNFYEFGIIAPFYWHNGTRTNLPTCEYAASIFVSGTDIYVAGEDQAGKPCYWKNGIRAELPISSSSLVGVARSIFVSGTDIYVAGHTSNPSAFPGYPRPYTPCYWKNGVRTDLSPILGTTSSIFVSGTDIYIAGDSLTSNYHTPGYWENGQRINLSSGGDATSIFVSGTDVYVAGYQASKPCYWKNGLRTDLPGSAGYPAMSIFVSGGEVYVAGNSYDTSSNTQMPCYWKNDARIDLSYSSDGGIATSIFVSGTDVFVAGGSNDFSRTGIPCYWKNGQRMDISGNGYLTSIFVKQ